MVLMKEKGSFVLPLRFRDLDHALHNFDDGLFSIQSCFPNILYSSTLLIWEKQRNLTKTFTDPDRVMKNCNVTTLYQLSLKRVKAPSLLRNSARAWATTAWQFLNTSCAEGLWMSLAKFYGHNSEPQSDELSMQAVKSRKPIYLSCTWSLSKSSLKSIDM